MPCNDSGYFDAAFAAKFGIADFDWSNAKQLWANAKPMNCEELLVEQVAKIKAINPNTKVFVYRNLVKALPWYTNVRTKISDPAYAGWFLKFSGKNDYHVPQCDKNFDPPKCTEFYHDQDQTPQHPKGDGSCVDPCDCGGVPCGEYLWDHRNATLQDYLINHVILGDTGLGNANISGFYLDDHWRDTPLTTGKNFCDHSPIGGASEEDYYCTADMGLVQADTTAITKAWADTISKVHDAIATHGGWSWQQFRATSTPTKANCAAYFRGACNAKSAEYTSALRYQYTWDNKQVSPLPQFGKDLAGFLLVRGPYAWLGYGWSGCSRGSDPPGANGRAYEFPDALTVDYGEPSEICHETSSGVFERKWSKALIQFDCNTYTATITTS